MHAVCCGLRYAHAHSGRRFLSDKPVRDALAFRKSFRYRELVVDTAMKASLQIYLDGCAHAAGSAFSYRQDHATGRALP